MSNPHYTLPFDSFDKTLPVKMSTVDGAERYYFAVNVVSPVKAPNKKAKSEKELDEMRKKLDLLSKVFTIEEGTCIYIDARSVYEGEHAVGEFYKHLKDMGHYKLLDTLPPTTGARGK